MSRRLNVVFFVPDLTGGGAERMAVEYLSRLDRQKFNPHLVVCTRTGVHLDRVPPDIPIFDLGKRSRFSFFRLPRKFADVMSGIDVDIVVSFLWYCDAIQLLARSARADWCAVCSLHSVPRKVRHERVGVVKSWLMRRLYPGVDAIMAVSKAVADEFAQRYGIGDEIPVWQQPNPFPLSEIRAKSLEPHAPWPVAAGNRLVAVGRFHPDKGFDLLLTALSKMTRTGPWHMQLLGSGELSRELKNLAQRLDLEGRVSFPGYIENPYPVIRSADVLVLSSRFEAFPSVVIEALALETVVVAFRCPTGPAEILEDGHCGFLVAPEDPLAMAAAIERALDDRERAATLRAAGLERVRNWDASTVVKAFEDRLTSLVTIHPAVDSELASPR